MTRPESSGSKQSSVKKYYGPPGTGKTTLLMNLVQEELKRGTPPTDITYCSFTRAASHHARDLALSHFPELGRDDFGNFATIHSICYRILALQPANVFNDRQLRKFAEAYKYELSNYEEDPLSQSFIELKMNTVADYYENFISWQKNMMIWDIDVAYDRFIRSQVELPSEFEPHGLKLYIERRRKWQEENSQWDFSDMLIGVLRDKMTPLPVCTAFFLDEAQDNSPLLFEVAKMWASRAERTHIAGDPYQCLYEFSGADPALMIDFPADETVTLKQGHRCPQAVHDVARQIASRFRVRYQDDDFLPTGEAGRVNHTFLGRARLDGDNIFSPEYPSTFVLFRTNYLMDAFIADLIMAATPFSVRRRRGPLDRKISKVVRALYELSGEQTISMADLKNIIEEVPSKPYLIRGAKTKIRKAAEAEGGRSVSWRSLTELGFTRHFLDGLFNDPLACLQMKPEEKTYFHKIIGRYGAAHLGETRPRLQIGTIHSVKGLEADRVFLSLEMTRLPFENMAMNPDSENRVFYVGVTRARYELGLITPFGPRAYPL
jgi:DNA helicase-2/ATP-dependent DNA helicase PcrA